MNAMNLDAKGAVRTSINLKDGFDRTGNSTPFVQQQQQRRPDETIKKLQQQQQTLQQ